MLKILLVSDNHGDRSSIQKILHDNPNCDYYFHCGDALLPADQMKPFLVVKGNNDYGNDYPNQRIINIGSHRILLIHGSGYTWNINDLYAKAIKEKVDTVFFGHTHEFYDRLYLGIRMINPGSCYYNRDFSAPSYARVYIDEEDFIHVQRVDI